VLDAARDARAQGATRFCMGAAWRNPTDRNLERVIEMVRAVREQGLETCMTLGMLTPAQAQRLAEAGLDYYNHNLDTSPEFYGEIITTRTYQERLDTLEHVRGGHERLHRWASSAWANRAATARACCSSCPTCRVTPSRCRSTCWCRWRARRCTAPRRWTPSSSSAPSRWRAS
jgi:hypothetical protein